MFCPTLHSDQSPPLGTLVFGMEEPNRLFQLPPPRQRLCSSDLSVGSNFPQNFSLVCIDDSHLCLPSRSFSVMCSLMRMLCAKSAPPFDTLAENAELEKEYTGRSYTGSACYLAKCLFILANKDFACTCA